MSAHPEISVVAAIIWRGDRYLCVRRPPGKAMAGLWEFPGGKLEPGETPEDALVRELEEELAIRPREFAFFREKAHSYPHLAVRLHFFQVAAFDGTPRALEGQRLAWMTPSKARDLPFLEADRDVVEELAAGTQEG